MSYPRKKREPRRVAPGARHVILGSGCARHWQTAQRVLALPPLPDKTLYEVIDVLGA